MHLVIDGYSSNSNILQSEEFMGLNLRIGECQDLL